MFDHIRIILLHTTHGGNIGAVARAMKNMGLARLYLVRPRAFPSAEASARASGADDLLANAKVCDSLEQALTDCSLVMGASARDRRIAWPQVDARQCARLALSQRGEAQVAWLFGRESSGLSNEELERCHYLVRIPGNPAFSSLNLAAAVQIMAYELIMARQGTAALMPPSSSESPSASGEQMEGFYGHLQRTLTEIGFLEPTNPGQLMRRLRRMFNRMGPDQIELNILRGMLRAVEEKSGRETLKGEGQ